MGKTEEDFLRMWKKRICNMPDCLAFHFTDQDLESVLRAEMIRKERGMEAAIGEVGMLSGTCRISNLEVVINADCIVPDARFVKFFVKSKL